MHAMERMGAQVASLIRTLQDVVAVRRAARMEFLTLKRHSARPAKQGRTNRTAGVPDRQRSPVRLAVKACHLPDKL